MESDSSHSLVSRQFSNQYVWLRYKKNKDLRWNIYNTEMFRKEAVGLEQTFFSLMNSDSLKWKKRKKLWKKSQKWRFFHRIYGLKDLKTLYYFKRLIRYIEKNEDFAEENHEDDDVEDYDNRYQDSDSLQEKTDDDLKSNDDSNDDDEFSVNTDENDEYEGYADDGHGDINSYQDKTADESQGYDKKFATELRTYQVLLDDVQRWLKDAQTTISREIKLTSKKVVKSQIRGIENLEKNLCARSAQLEHLLKGVLKLTDGRDGQSLANHMVYSLGSVRDVMEGLHLCLRLRLEQLQETLEKMVIEPPKRSAREFLSDLEDILSLKDETDSKVRPPLLQEFLESTSGKTKSINKIYENEKTFENTFESMIY